MLFLAKYNLVKINTLNINTSSTPYYVIYSLENNLNRVKAVLRYVKCEYHACTRMTYHFEFIEQCNFKMEP